MHLKCKSTGFIQIKTFINLIKTPIKVIWRFRSSRLTYLVPFLCRSTGHWPWKKRASKHVTARCPASPREVSDPETVSRSSPSACRTRPLRFAAPALWQATCRTWATCHLSATPDTCCPRRLPSTRRSATRTIPAGLPHGPNLTEVPPSLAFPQQRPPPRRTSPCTLSLRHLSRARGCMLG